MAEKAGADVVNIKTRARKPPAAKSPPGALSPAAPPAADPPDSDLLDAAENASPSHELPPTTHNLGVADEDDVRVYIRTMIAFNKRRKDLNAEIAAYRKTARGQGIELGQADHVIRMLEWKPEEIKTWFDNGRKYAEAMGMPVGTQLELFGDDRTPDLVREQLRWRGQGRIDGLAGRGSATQVPDGCPPEHRQTYGEGWHEGQKETQESFLRRQNRKGDLI